MVYRRIFTYKLQIHRCYINVVWRMWASEILTQVMIILLLTVLGPLLSLFFSEELWWFCAFYSKCIGNGVWGLVFVSSLIIQVKNTSLGQLWSKRKEKINESHNRQEWTKCLKVCKKKKKRSQNLFCCPGHSLQNA